MEASTPPPTHQGPDSFGTAHEENTEDEARPLQNLQASLSPLSYPMRFSTFLEEWWWELTTWALGTGALAGTIAIMCIYDKSPSDHWKSGINFSATINILSQVAQSALMVSISSSIGQLKWLWLLAKRSTMDIDRFDSASRGPEGCSKLIVGSIVRRLRSPKRPISFIKLLALFGALITLLMLLFGPFAQQAVGIETRPLTTDSDGAIIARSTSYPFIAGSPYIDDHTVQTGPLSVHTYMTSRISDAMGSPQTPSHVKGRCPTADCSWEPYTSLGICYFAENISGTIMEITAGESSGGSYKLITVKDLRDTDGPLVATSLSLYVDPVLAGIRYRNKTMQERVENGRPLNTLVDIYLIYTPPCAMLNSTKSSPKSPETSLESNQKLSSWRAYRATLSACIQRLDSSITDGTANTNVLEENIPSNWSLVDIDMGTSNHSAIQTHHSNQSFFLTETGARALWGGLQHKLRGNGSYPLDGDTYYTSDSLAILTNDVNGENSPRCNEGPDLGFNGFDRRMKNLAVALSNQFRTLSNGTQPVFGTSSIDVPYIIIDFAWLTMPITIWVFATLMLVSTLIEAMVKKVPLWKSYPLALLDSTDPDNNLTSKPLIKQDARSTNAQLSTKDGERWYLERWK